MPSGTSFKKICNTCLEENIKQKQENKKLREKEYRTKYYQSKKDWYQQYYQDNKEKISQSYYDNKQKHGEYQKQYRIDNPNYHSDYSKEYYKENKEYAKEYNKQYREDNPEVYRLHTQKRNIVKDNLPNTLNNVEWNKIMEDFNHSCAYCGISEGDHLKKWGEILHREHFIALSNGGGYEVGNIIPSCRSCNSSKRSRDFFEWYPNYEHYDEDRMNFILTYLNIEVKEF